VTQMSEDQYGPCSYSAWICLPKMEHRTSDFNRRVDCSHRTRISTMTTIVSPCPLSRISLANVSTTEFRPIGTRGT
jgi:hypothetical protein